MSPGPAVAVPQPRRFAVFLSHNSRDKAIVKTITEKLRGLGRFRVSLPRDAIDARRGILL